MVRKSAKSSFIERWPKKERGNKKKVMDTMDYNGWALQHASKMLKDDMDVVKTAIKNEPLAIQFASYRIRNNLEFMKDLILKDACTFEFASPKLRADIKVFELTFEDNEEDFDDDYEGKYIFEYFNTKENKILKAFPQMIPKFVKLTPFIVINWLNHREFAKRLVSLHGMVLRYLPCYQNDKEFIELAITSWPKALKYASDEIHQDKDFVKSILKKEVCCFPYTGYNIRSDKEIVMEVLETGSMWNFLPAELQQDIDVLIQIVTHWPSMAPRIMEETDSHFLSHNFYLRVAEKQGRYSKEFPLKIQGSKEIMLAAIENYSSAFLYCSDELTEDKEFVLLALDKNKEAIQYVSSELREDIDVVIAVVLQDASLFKFIPSSVKNDVDFMKELMISVDNFELPVRKRIYEAIRLKMIGPKSARK